MIKALWAALALAVFWMFGLPEQIIDRFGEWIGAGVAFLALFAVVFLINLIGTPARIDVDQRGKISDLKKQISDKDARQAAVDQLWNLRTSGVNLRNTNIPAGTEYDAEYDAWYVAYNDWHTEVVEEAKKVSINLSKWLEILDSHRNQPVYRQWRDEKHLHMLCVFSEILDRLGVYLKREILKD